MPSVIGPRSHSRRPGSFTVTARAASLSALGQRKDQTSPNVVVISTELLSEDFDHSRVTSLRHTVASCAAVAGLDGARLEDFVVAVNELLTNAVRHGGGSGHVSLWLDNGSLICEVIDHGPGLPEPRAAYPSRPIADEPGGWGLWLAGKLTDTFEVTSGNDGTVVRISSRLPQ